MTTSITKLTPTNEVHPAVGRIFIIELSNGERFKVSADELINSFCYSEGENLKTGYDDEKIDRMFQNNFQELVGESWESE
jgi:hypothetical protein